MDEEKLQLEFYDAHNGNDILRCIQCGTCSGSCPLTDRMDHAPRELFALIRDGEMTAVLSSNTQWFCVSCYQCMVRCPQDIPVTDLMYSLKEMAVKYRLTSSAHKMSDLYRAFTGEIERSGKMNETFLMARYGLKHPLDMIPKALLGLQLLTRGRLGIHSEKVKDPGHTRFQPEDDTERKIE
jgi:quinone-modifying oxidoreductase, subunit QmoC